MNRGVEHVWFTTTGGKFWIDATGDLIQAAATVAMARPAGLEFVEDIDEIDGVSALLVGTVNGLFVTFYSAHRTPGHWARLGACSDMPATMVTAITYDAYTDSLHVATFGRGVYTMQDAKLALHTLMLQQDAEKCEVASPKPAPSNAYLLPAQQAC